jgi:DNA-binding transcriptional MocR family regulator
MALPTNSMNVRAAGEALRARRQTRATGTRTAGRRAPCRRRSGRQAGHRGRRHPLSGPARLRHPFTPIPSRCRDDPAQATRAAASRAGAAIIEDDYDSEFRHTARPLEPLQRLDRDGRVIYVGTFSKTLSPALRVGFLVAPRSLITSICALRQVIDWCPPLPTQIALTDLIADGYLDRHLRRSRTVYRERHRLLWHALRQILPAGCQLLPAQAGLHVAIVRPKLPADRQVWSLLESRGLQIGSLRRTYHFTDPAAGFLVGFGGLPTSSVSTACQVFVQALEEVEPADDFSGGQS